MKTKQPSNESYQSNEPSASPRPSRLAASFPVMVDMLLEHDKFQIHRSEFKSTLQIVKPSVQMIRFTLQVIRSTLQTIAVKPILQMNQPTLQTVNFPTRGPNPPSELKYYLIGILVLSL